jgi:galactokinase
MASSILERLAEVTSDYFRKEFHRPPLWIAAAPGRVNLIGEHVDYNDGFVLPMAIDSYCVIAGRDAPGDSATIFSVATGDRVNISLASRERNATPGQWSNYIAGVIAGFANRAIQVPGFQAAIHSMVPVGGGLSSSAAIEVATATLLEAMTGTMLNPAHKALLCQKAEHEFAGVPCGIMDQFASVMGRADYLMLLDCRSQQIEHIPFTDPDVTVLVANTNVKHALAGGEYAERRRQCESVARTLGVSSLRDVTREQLEDWQSQLGALEYRRARHVVTEIERTIEAAAAVKAGDWPTVGRLMYASHDSLRDDYEVSCDELDLFVELARNIGSAGGIIGSRMTGAGFGGCTVSLVETAKLESIAKKLEDTFHAKTGIEPGFIATRPARGAHVIR